MYLFIYMVVLLCVLIYISYSVDGFGVVHIPGPEERRIKPYLDRHADNHGARHRGVPSHLAEKAQRQISQMDTYFKKEMQAAKERQDGREDRHVARPPGDKNGHPAHPHTHTHDRGREGKEGSLRNQGVQYITGSGSYLLNKSKQRYNPKTMIDTVQGQVNALRANVVHNRVHKHTKLEELPGAKEYTDKQHELQKKAHKEYTDVLRRATGGALDKAADQQAKALAAHKHNINDLEWNKEGNGDDTPVGHMKAHTNTAVAAAEKSFTEALTVQKREHTAALEKLEAQFNELSVVHKSLSNEAHCKWGLDYMKFINDEKPTKAIFDELTKLRTDSHVKRIHGLCTKTTNGPGCTKESCSNIIRSIKNILETFSSTHRPNEPTEVEYFQRSNKIILKWKTHNDALHLSLGGSSNPDVDSDKVVWDNVYYVITLREIYNNPNNEVIQFTIDHVKYEANGEKATCGGLKNGIYYTITIKTVIRNKNGVNLYSQNCSDAVTTAPIGANLFQPNGTQNYDCQRQIPRG